MWQASAAGASSRVLSTPSAVVNETSAGAIGAPSSPRTIRTVARS